VGAYLLCLASTAYAAAGETFSRNALGVADFRYPQIIGGLKNAHRRRNIAPTALFIAMKPELFAGLIR
jgi:hypothetical protein